MSASRAEVVATARSYLGTPWHHLERQPGIGMDCAGLVICTMRALALCAPDFDVPPYVPVPDGASMLAQCDAYLTRTTHEAMLPGDVVCLITDRYPQHLGIVGDDPRGGVSLIHAANSAEPPRVVEHRLMFSRICRFVAAYRLPGIA